jgi:hypothetical protein
MDGNETCSRPTMPPGDDERAKAADSPPIASYRDPTPDTRVVTWLDGEDLRIYFFFVRFFFPVFFSPGKRWRVRRFVWRGWDGFRMTGNGA